MPGAPTLCSAVPMPRLRQRSRLLDAAIAVLLLVAAAVLVKVVFFGGDEPPSPVTIETRLEEIEELRTARMTVSGTVRFGKTADAWWQQLGELLVGDNVTLAGTMTLDGYIDLRNLRPDSVEVDGDSVTIRVPHPKLSEPSLDVGSIRVMDERRGVLTRIDDVVRSDRDANRELFERLERELDAQVEDQRDELLETARQSAESVLATIMEGVGFTDVTVEFGEGGA